MTPRPMAHSARPSHRRQAPKKYKPYKMRVPQTLWLVPLALLLGFGGMFGYFAAEEIRTSKIQADTLVPMAQDIRFSMEAGEDPAFYAPNEGPYNQRLGYSYLPFFIKGLKADGYAVAQQMRASPQYHELIERGLYPIYKAKSVAGFTLRDRAGEAFYSVRTPARVFADFSLLPPLLVNTLAFVENRDLLKESPPTHNPVIEWNRFFYAAMGRFVQNVAPGFNVGGGSTLATQIEKFRFSPGGQTNDVIDKLKQIASASLRVYMDGADTRAASRRIVLDYLNSTPLSARPGFGEINSLGDGMWAWFGHDLTQTGWMLNLPDDNKDAPGAKAILYREALGLILAQRRPSHYLIGNRQALDELTNATLDRLQEAEIISPALRDAAQKAAFRFLPEAPEVLSPATFDPKATNALRAHLVKMIGLKNFYELDRIDLEATSTLDRSAQQKVADFLRKMSDPDFVDSIGLFGPHLLSDANDPAAIKWSVVLFERGPDGNRLRVQADNVDGPFDMNEGMKLDLGSTAKLRTLVTYLEIISELYRRYAGLSEEDLEVLADEAPDSLTEWTTTWLMDNPDATLEQILAAAMERTYSGNADEAFFTGGGIHHFVNFDKADDSRRLTVRAAFQNSVNLVFVRLMQDIVNYTIGQGPQTREELLNDPDHPARKEYLERYADREGTTFLGRYINEYADLSADAAMAKLWAKAHKGATARAILYRAIRPKASVDDFIAYMQKHTTRPPDETQMRKLYRDYPAERYSLSDRGYIAGVNPLELWLVSYKQENPRASRNAIVNASRPVRIDSYAWLFHPRQKGAQDTRIRILLEMDAFARIQKRWARLGYPFEKLVPSFATAIGSSADRPDALAELVGILLNDGARKPTFRFDAFRFAADTPYETIMTPASHAGEQVIDPAVARTVRASMVDVVENGTAKRLAGAYLDAEGKSLTVGGKTGTGDHRFDEFAPGGKLISSRVVNRTGTIVFFIGDKFFGTVTAHVAGEEAANFKFTSALSAQMLRSMQPILQPLIAPMAKSAKTPAPQQANGPEADEGDSTDEEEDE